MRLKLKTKTKIMLVAALLLSLLGSFPSVAQDAECRSPIAQVLETTKAQDISADKLSDAEVLKLVEVFGPPPVPFDSVYFFYANNIAVFGIVENGCLVMTTPAVSLDAALKAIGRVSASQ